MVVKQFEDEAKKFSSTFSEMTKLTWQRKFVQLINKDERRKTNQRKTHWSIRFQSFTWNWTGFSVSFDGLNKAWRKKFGSIEIWFDDVWLVVVVVVVCDEELTLVLLDDCDVDDCWSETYIDCPSNSRLWYLCTACSASSRLAKTIWTQPWLNVLISLTRPISLNNS